LYILNPPIFILTIPSISLHKGRSPFFFDSLLCQRRVREDLVFALY